jgi:hypothetical protein
MHGSATPRSLWIWLNRAALQRDMNFVCAPVDRAFESLRADPRFMRLLERHGLRPIWALPDGARR